MDVNMTTQGPLTLAFFPPLFTPFTRNARQVGTVPTSLGALSASSLPPQGSAASTEYTRWSAYGCLHRLSSSSPPAPPPPPLFHFYALPSGAGERPVEAAPPSTTATAVSTTCCSPATTEDGCSTLATTSAANSRSSIRALCRSGAATAALSSRCARATSSATNSRFSVLSSPAQDLDVREQFTKRLKSESS